METQIYGTDTFKLWLRNISVFNPKYAEEAARRYEKAYLKFSRSFAELDAEDGGPWVMREFQKLINRTLLKRKAMGDSPVTCSKGCSACCHIQVDMTRMEWNVIKKFCANNGIEIDREHLAKQVGLSNSDFVRKLTPEESRCVFLKNRECSIYDVRPLACRKFLVVSDPKECRRDGESAQVIEVEMEAFISAFWQRFDSKFIAEMVLEDSP